MLAPNCCKTVVGDSFGDGSLTGWTQVAGSWTESSGVLTTSSTDAVIVNDTAHAGGGGTRQSVRAQVKAAATGTKLRLIVGYTDASNYLFAELEFLTDCATLSVGENNAGTPSLLATIDLGYLPLSTFHELTVCFDPEIAEPFQAAHLAAHLKSAAEKTFSVEGVPAVAGGSQAGAGTGDAVGGTVTFDDWEFLDREADSCCCPDCTASPSCTLATDDFNRSNGSVATTGCLWTEVSGTWTISSNQLKTTGTGGLIVHKQTHTNRLKITAGVKLPANGDKARVLLGYKASDGSYWAVELEAGATCGKIKLVRFSGSDTTLGQFTVEAPGLGAGAYHLVQLCYLFNLQQLVALVTVSGGGTFGHHADGVNMNVSDPQAGFATSSGSGDFFFEDFTLQKHKHKLDPACPCCCPPDCETFSDGFGDGSIDCRWTQDAGSWTESGSTISTSSASARLISKAGWSGLRRDGLGPAPATTVEATFQSATYGAEATAIVDYKDASNFKFARVKLASDANETTPGTLTIWQRSGGSNTQLDSENVPGLLVDLPITFRVCYAAGRLQATCKTRLVDATAADHGGKQAGIGTGTGGATILFDSVVISHHQYEDVNCAFCAGGANDAPVITTNPITTATECVLYQYAPLHRDYEDDPVIWCLVIWPTGMVIDALTGVVSWVPSDSQAGNHTVKIAVRSRHDGLLLDCDHYQQQTEQQYTITVAEGC